MKYDYLYVVQLFFTIFDRDDGSIQLLSNVRFPLLQIVQDAFDNGLVFLELDEGIVKALL